MANEGNSRIRPPACTQADLFLSGENGYHTYRIPALLTTQKGTILAFCEGRRNSRSDTDDIDVLLRRSYDNGETWTDMQIVADMGGDTIGNPCPVQDPFTGAIWRIYPKGDQALRPGGPVVVPSPAKMPAVGQLAAAPSLGGANQDVVKIISLIIGTFGFALAVMVLARRYLGLR